MNKEQLFLFFSFFFPVGKGYGFTALRTGHAQGSLDAVPSVAEADRQFFSVRAHVENPKLPHTKRWEQTPQPSRKEGEVDPGCITPSAVLPPSRTGCLPLSLSLKVTHSNRNTVTPTISVQEQESTTGATARDPCQTYSLRGGCTPVFLCGWAAGTGLLGLLHQTPS